MKSSSLIFSVPGRYAQALIAMESHDFLNDFDRVFRVLKQDDKLFFLLNSVHLNRSEMIKFIDALSQDLDLNDCFKNFLKIVILNKRFSLLDEIYLCYEKLLYQRNNKRIVYVYSAFDLTDVLKKEINHFLDKIFSEVLIIRYKIDNSFLGGVLIETDNFEINATLSQQIDLFCNDVLNLKFSLTQV